MEAIFLGEKKCRNRIPRTDQITVEKVEELFENDPKLSIRKASETLDISTAMVYRVLRQTVFLFP